MKTRHILALSIPVALLAAAFLLGYLASPTKEQWMKSRLYEIGNDIYDYRSRHGAWPPSIRAAWEESPRIHKDSWDAYSTDVWGHPVEYRIEDDKTAFLTVRRERRDAARDTDDSRRMERRLSVDDPLFESFVPLTNSTHDADF